METTLTSLIPSIQAITVIMTLISVALLMLITFVKGASPFNYNLDGAIGYVFFLSRCVLLIFLTFSISSTDTMLVHFTTAITAVVLTTYNCAQWFQSVRYECRYYVRISRQLTLPPEPEPDFDKRKTF